MAAPDLRTCPSCGTRNKAGWEYCVRCGEDMRAVPTGPAATTAAPEVTPVAENSSWLGLVGPVVAIGLTFYATNYLYHHHPQGATRPSPALFDLPALPPSTVAARPDVAPSGESDYAEGLRLLSAGDAVGAAAAFARAVAQAPENAAYHNIYAKALSASNAPVSEMVRQFEEAIRLSPQSASYVGDLARAYDHLGRNDEAARMYARALEISPHDGPTLHEISSLYLRMGRPEAALPYLKVLQAGSSDDLNVQQDLGAALEKSGDREGAKRAYQDILQKYPQAAITRGLLAEIFINEGKNDDAIALLRAGVSSEPDAALLHRTLASALERTGNVAEAVREYREYARLNPNAADAKSMEDRAARLEARVAQSS
jgi:predicted Zn-dependent protease